MKATYSALPKFLTTLLLTTTIANTTSANTQTTPLESAAAQQETPVRTSEGKVTISSKGDDVREVLYYLFQQTGHNFVLDAGVRFVLYLHLENVEFKEALDIVLKNAQIGYEVKNGVYFIGRNRGVDKSDPKPAQTNNQAPTQNQPQAKPQATPQSPRPTPPPAPAGRLTNADLQRRLTTRLSMTDIRAVFAEFGRQTGVRIIVADHVPAYKLDAFLLNTSLKYALDVVTEAAKLKWSLTNERTILIEKIER